MLDSWIIEEIRKREKPREEDQPVVELPLDQDPDQEHQPVAPAEEEPPERGIVIIDLYSGEVG